jgi:hypothetical protein
MTVRRFRGTAAMMTMDGGNPARESAVERVMTGPTGNQLLGQVSTPMTPITAGPSADVPSLANKDKREDPAVARGRRAGIAWAT